MTINVGRYAGKELRFIPSWYLRFLVKSWSDKGIREEAKTVLEARSRLGLPEKPKSKAKKQDETPIEPRKREIVPVSFIPENANDQGDDAF